MTKAEKQADEEGRRAAARGDSGNENPYVLLANARDAGYDYALSLQRKKLDIGGHPQSRPHTCAADVTKVCTCCSTCSLPCTRRRLRNIVRGIVGYVRERLR